MTSRPEKISSRLRQRLSGVYAWATRSGSRLFQASSARRALRAAVSSSNGGTGGLVTTVMVGLLVAQLRAQSTVLRLQRADSALHTIERGRHRGRVELLWDVLGAVHVPRLHVEHDGPLRAPGVPLGREPCEEIRV